MTAVSWRRIRSSELVGLTLIELLLLLSFALLIVIVVFFREREDAQKELAKYREIEREIPRLASNVNRASLALLGKNESDLGDEIPSSKRVSVAADVTDRLAEIGEQLRKENSGPNTLPDVWNRLVRTTAELKQAERERDEAIGRLTSLERDRNALQSELAEARSAANIGQGEPLGRAISELKERSRAIERELERERALRRQLEGPSPTTLSDVRRRVIELESAAAEKEKALVEARATRTEALSRLAVAEDERTRVLETLTKRTAEFENVSGQLQVLRRINRGRDKPPCWATLEGGIEYLYTITIREDEFGLEPAWPARRSEAARDLGALSQLQTFDMAGFRKLAAIPYSWGIRPENDCRFYVYVIDKARSKEAWKANLAEVERYFYKDELKKQ